MELEAQYYWPIWISWAINKFFRIVFFYQNTQIFSYYIYQLNNICDGFFFLEKFENMQTFLIFCYNCDSMIANNIKVLVFCFRIEQLYCLNFLKMYSFIQNAYNIKVKFGLFVLKIKSKSINIWKNKFGF